MTVKENHSLESLVKHLDSLLSTLPTNYDLSKFSETKLKAIRIKLANYSSVLLKISRNLDKIKHPQVIFDPSDPRVVGKLIGLTLIEQPRISMTAVTPFYGSGIYAIYYKGNFKAYRPISETNNPIYVGKADPQVLDAKTPQEQGDKLYGRFAKDHAKSIMSASNIDIADFDCRYLVVKSAWQKTAEDYLIDIFKPIWNNEMGICYGFGKHGDSHLTRGNTRSPWDTLHPGRLWATSEGNKPNPKSPAEISAEIAEHFKKYPPVDISTLAISFST
jgi:hypothetical protein